MTHRTTDNAMPRTIDDSIQAPLWWRTLSHHLVTMHPDDLILVLDPAGYIVLAGGRLADRLGVFPGMAGDRAMPGLWPAIRQSLSDGHVRRHLECNINGAKRLAAVHPLQHDGQVSAAVLILEDRKTPAVMVRQMRELAEMARERDAIIDSSSDGLFVCDSDATVIRINPASQRIHKVRADAIIGKNMVDLIQQGFIDRSAALEAIQQRTTVSLLQNKDNRKLISTGTPVFDDDGSLIRVVVSERDITEIDTLQRRLEAEQALKDQLRLQLAEIQQETTQTQRIVARSPGMLRVLQQALKVSRADSSVLITGESGVGKGLIADLIHNHSNRAKNPLIRINCGAIPESLVESELFGYEKGAFTGARAGGKPGHLELAHGGTLFLDEVAELPPSAQVKLLRFLEDGRLTRLGGTQPRQVDARIIAATHRDLKRMVAAGTFRQDLYYRLNVIPLAVPPIRERKACLLPLLRHYIDHFARRGGTAKRLSRAAIDALSAYPFPGNVRELMNICERAVVMSETAVIDLQDLPRDIVSQAENADDPTTAWPPQMTLEQILQSVERALLLETLKTHPGQVQTARALGVSQPTIARRMKKYGLADLPSKK